MEALYHGTLKYMAKEMEPSHILHELEPVVEDRLNWHQNNVRPWNPHEYVPWSEGRNFAMLGGEDWSPEQSRLSEIGKAAMFVNLLTEDNLPSYHREIAEGFGRDGAWGTWVGQWTAEEARHGIAMRDFLVVTRAIDPVALEEARMQHMTAGYDSGDKTSLEAIAYVTLQELATRISHRNTGREARHDDPLAEHLLARIAEDENFHMIFYRSLGSAALEIAPNQMMRAITTEVNRFEMPGAKSIPEFRRLAVMLAKAGIYDPSQHLKHVLKPTLLEWDVDNLSLSGDGDKARDELHETLDKQHAEVARFEERREAAQAREAKRAGENRKKAA